MTPYRGLSFLVMLPLALTLAACSGDDEEPLSICDELDCGPNAYCDEDLEECVCEDGFAMFEGECIDSRLVECEDVAPQNATSDIEEVEIAWTEEDGWADPEECAWSCDPDFDLVDGECIDTQMVECDDVAPENGTSTIEMVEITYTDADGWSEVPECPWTCDSGYVPWNDECVDTRMVPCDDSDIPNNATADVVDVEITYTEEDGWSSPAACDWQCDEGYGEHNGQCVESRTVQCLDVAPDNAVSDIRYVSVGWDDEAGDWEEPAPCDWSCQTGYGEYEGECLQSAEVPCNDDPPANAETTDDSVLVTIEWDGEAWPAPEQCPWECLADYDLVEGECLNERWVPCDDSGTPDNASPHAEDVEITYTDADGWTDPAQCDWSCDSGFGEVDGECVDSIMVACADDPPANAATTDDTVEVEVTWDEDAQDWTDPDVCPWECIESHHEENGQCVENVDIGWCNVQWPDEIEEEFIDRPLEFFGQVWAVDDLTAGEERLPGITAKLCYGGAPIELPADLDSLECVTAHFNEDAEDTGNNDEYMTLHAFEMPGDYEYVFAFSGDGGESWMSCLTDDEVPGFASIFGPENGDFEDWIDDGDGNLVPVGWSGGSGVGIEREEANVFTGEYAVRLTRVEDDNAATEFTSELSPVVEGMEYDIDMWFFDDDPDIRGRHIYQWFDSEMNALGAAEYGTYTSAQDEWQLHTQNVTAPNDAAFVRVATRLYDEVDASLLLGKVIVRPAAPTSQWVDCLDDPPVNAYTTDDTVQVEVYWDEETEEWSEPDLCPWACEEDFGVHPDYEGQCLQTVDVDCDDSAIPDNSVAIVVGVEIQWDEAEQEWTEPAACEWECDSGFDEVDGECLSSQWVDCVDTSPDNASALVETVEITYTDADGWSEPAECAWECDSGYGEHPDHPGECHDSLEVLCDADIAVPDNASVDEEHVTIHWDDDTGWTDPAECTWSCDTDFYETDGQCIDTMMVECDSSGTPDNATAEIVDVEITYTDADGWSEPAECAWECDSGYGEHSDHPGECHDSLEVLCDADIDVPDNASVDEEYVTITWDDDTGWTDPAECAWSCDADFDELDGECINTMVVECDSSGTPDNATAEIVDVEITYTDADGWTAPDACAWSCDEGYHEEDGACVMLVDIGWCNVHYPDETSTSIGLPELFFGRVWVDGLTGQSVEQPELSAKWCFSEAPIVDPEDLDSLECLDAEFNLSDGNDDEYMAAHAFEFPGEHEYIFAFSSDGGESWTSCYVDDADSPRDGLPGLAIIDSFPINGDFEYWFDDGDGNLLPEAWSGGTAVDIEREEANVFIGEYAVRLTRTGTNNAATEFTSELSPVAEGMEYEIDMWFFDDDPTVRGRHIYQWFDSSMEQIAGASYGSYTSENPDEWQLLRSTVTAPEGAVFVRVATRLYDDVGGSLVLGGVFVRPVMDLDP